MTSNFKRECGGALLLGCLLATWLMVDSETPMQAATRKAKKKPTVTEPVEAAHPAQQSEKQAGEEKFDADEKIVRLNFFSASWNKVLAKLAEQSHSTLVMHAVPPGHYTSHDLHKYTRKEAVRILNNELEPEGFRILEKDNFLVVVQIKVLNTRYPRPKIPAAGTKQVQQQENAASESNSTTAAASPKTKREKMRTASVKPKASRKSAPSDIVQAAGEEESGTSSGVQTADQLVPQTDTTEEPVAPAETSTETAKTQASVVKMKHKTARDVAQSVYRAFKPRAELVEKGPHGLPAFRGFRAAKPPATEIGKAAGDEIVKAKGELLFTIEIDTDGQQLLIEAAPKVAEDLAGLLRALDTPENENGNTIQIMPAPNRTQQIARNLEPNVARLVAQRRQDEAGNAANPPVAADPANPGAQPPKSVEGLMGGIKGDVKIESMEGLGVVIIEGNEQDVELMKQVIKEIERMSLTAVPSVELKLLKNVNSESLAPLLTTVYDALTKQTADGGASRKLVNLFAVVKPNALLIVAPAEDMTDVIGLIDKLDRPVDPQMEFQVFPLKNAISSQITQEIEQFYEQRTGLGTKVKVVGDVRTNSIVVQARPADMQEITELVQKLDRDDSGAVAQMRIFPVRHASAEELAIIINRALLSVFNPAAATGTTGTTGAPTTGTGGPTSTVGPAGGGGRAGGGSGEAAQQLQQTKSVVLEFLAVDGEARKLVRSGVLSDIRVTADPRVNALVVTAPEQSMQLMAALIQQLDRPASTVSDIKIFSLINSDAEAMVGLLQSVFGIRSQQQGNQQAAAAAGDGAAPAFEDVDTSVLPLRFSVDARTNSIVAVGSGGALRVVEAILLRLDEGEVRGRKNTVIRLKNSPAPVVAEAINNFLTSQRDLAQIDPNLVSSTEMLEREIIAVPEPVSNSLLLSATPRYYDEILKMVAKLDEAPAQVVIQALLVEVDLQNTDEFGIELGFQDSILFDRSLTNIENFLTINDTVSNPGTGFSSQQQRIVSQEGVPGFLFNNTSIPLGNNFSTSSAKVGRQGLSNFSLGRLNNELGFGGLVLSASSESVSALLRALSAKRQIHVLSRPQIRTLDNQEATIHVGQQVPLVQSVTANQNFITPNIEQFPVGISLTVIPRISPDETIVMRTEAKKSALSNEGVPVFFDAVGDQTIEAPIIDIAQALATVSVASGQTVVLGGMITKSDDTLERKVPWLGDVPVVGRLFRYDSTTTRRTELLIFLTPRVIKSDADSELIKQVEAERLHFIEEEAEMIHGPLYGVPTTVDGAVEDVVVPPGPVSTPRGVVPVPPLPAPEQLPSDADVPMTVIPQKTEPARLLQASRISEQEIEAKVARSDDLPAEETELPTRDTAAEKEAGRVGLRQFSNRAQRKTK